jgi:hypothetical protein
MKIPNMFGMTRRPLPNVARLKIDMAKNRKSSEVSENMLIGFDFCKESGNVIRITI